MTAKQVTDRARSVQTVHQAVETHAQRVAKGWSELISPYLDEGEQVPDMILALKLAARHMESKGARLVERSRQHDLELSDDVLVQAQHEQAQEGLYGTIVQTRQSVEGVFGLLGLRVLGVRGRTPQEPEALLAMGRALSSNLLDPEVVLPDPLPGVSLDRAALAQRIQGKIDLLERARKELLKEKRESEATLSAKWKAMDENDKAFGRVARWLETTFALVGEEELAGRVRPSGRRPGRLQDPPEEPDTA